MDYDYGKLQSVSSDEFKRLTATCKKYLIDATLSDEDDIKRIERLLDLREGLLAGHQFQLQKDDCEHCNRRLTFYDFVFTAIVDAGHSKSFIVHTLLGSKLIINRPRNIRCSACSTVTTEGEYYSCDPYGCCQG